jgi:hypothetical protein
LQVAHSGSGSLEAGISGSLHLSEVTSIVRNDNWLTGHVQAVPKNHIGKEAIHVYMKDKGFCQQLTNPEPVLAFRGLPVAVLCPS